MVARHSHRKIGKHEWKINYNFLYCALVAARGRSLALILLYYSLLVYEAFVSLLQINDKVLPNQL